MSGGLLLEFDHSFSLELTVREVSSAEEGLFFVLATAAASAAAGKCFDTDVDHKRVSYFLLARVPLLCCAVSKRRHETFSLFDFDFASDLQHFCFVFFVCQLRFSPLALFSSGERANLCANTTAAIPDNEIVIILLCVCVCLLVLVDDLSTANKHHTHLHTGPAIDCHCHSFCLCLPCWQ